MIKRRSLFAGIAAAAAALVPGRTQAKPVTRDVTLVMREGEYALIELHPRGVDVLYPTVMLPGETWHSRAFDENARPRQNVHVIVPKGAATVTRTGKRIVIDLA